MSECVAPEIMKRLTFFNSMTPEVIEALCQRASLERYDKDAAIYNEGDRAEFFYIVLSGEVLVQKRMATVKEGYKTLVIAGKDGLFGEGALLGRETYLGRALVKSDAEILRINARGLEAYLEKDPHLAVLFLDQFINVLAHRLNGAVREQMALFELGRLIGAMKGLSELMPSVTTIIEEAIPEADSSFFALYHRYNDIYDIKAGEGLILNGGPDAYLKPDAPLVAMLGGSSHPYEGNPSKEQHLWGDLGITAQSALCSPIYSEGRLVGFMGLFSRDQEQAFTSEQKNLLHSVCCLLAPMIENESFRRDEEDRARMNRYRQ